jgi:hypothetical protein
VGHPGLDRGGAEMIRLAITIAVGLVELGIELLARRREPVLLRDDMTEDDEMRLGWSEETWRNVRC